MPLFHSLRPWQPSSDDFGLVHRGRHDVMRWQGRRLIGHSEAYSATWAIDDATYRVLTPSEIDTVPGSLDSCRHWRRNGSDQGGVPPFFDLRDAGAGAGGGGQWGQLAPQLGSCGVAAPQRWTVNVVHF